MVGERGVLVYVKEVTSSADPDIFPRGGPTENALVLFPDFNGCKPFTRKVNVSSSNHEDFSTFRTFFFYDCIIHKCCAISNQYHFTNPISTFCSGPPVPPSGSAHARDVNKYAENESVSRGLLTLH